MTTSAASQPEKSLKQQAAEELLRRREARRGLLPFTLYTKPDYEVNWHHQIISATLDRFLAGEIKRLMLFVPPRMGKTELASRRMPALVFGRNPDAAVMACSYNASYAAEVNRDVQRIMDSAEYRRLYPEAQLFGTNVRSNAKGTWLRNSDAFEIVGRKGVYRSAGIGVGIAGRGFEWGIIDDPVKGRADADSQAHRNHVWNWYLGDFFTRRADDSAAILLILTRWHQDDLAGRLLDQARQNPKLPQWTVVRFPALCEEEDRHPEDIRQPGQALWPARFDEAALEETRDTSGPREWAAVYQQRPSPASGTVFRQETFRYFTVEEQDGESWVVLMDHRTGEPAGRHRVRDCRFFQTADTALTVSKSSAYTCVGTFGLTPKFDLLVWHVWRERLAVPEQFGALTQLRDGAGVFDRVSRAWVTDGKAQPWPLRLLFQAVESQASGIGLIQQGASEGRPFKVLKADKDKVQRCGPVAGLYEAGKVWHRGGAPWLSRFEDELLVFPSGTFKDQCDVLGYAGILATEDKFLRSFQGNELLCWPPVPEKKLPDQGDKPVETVQNAVDSVLEKMLAEEEADHGRLPPLLRD